MKSLSEVAPGLLSFRSRSKQCDIGMFNDYVDKKRGLGGPKMPFWAKNVHLEVEKVIKKGKIMTT